MEIDVQGIVERFGIDSVVPPAGKSFDSPCAIRGHWLYCLRCTDPSDQYILETPDGPKELVLPDKSKNRSVWVEVIAKGHRVGKRRDWPKKKLRDWNIPRHLVNAIEVGDIILVPEHHGLAIRRSIYEHEFFVDEAFVICKAEEN